MLYLQISEWRPHQCMRMLWLKIATRTVWFTCRVTSIYPERLCNETKIHFHEDTQCALAETKINRIRIHIEYAYVGKMRQRHLCWVRFGCASLLALQKCIKTVSEIQKIRLRSCKANMCQTLPLFTVHWTTEWLLIAPKSRVAAIVSKFTRTPTKIYMHM